MQCYIGDNGTFSAVEQFISTQLKLRHIIDMRQGLSQANSIKGSHIHLDQYFFRLYDFARTAEVVLRMHMLTATNVGHQNELCHLGNLPKQRNLGQLICVQNTVPSPSSNGVEEKKIVACYSCLFSYWRMKDFMDDMQDGMGDTRFINDFMIIVKPGQNDIEIWYIITTMRVYREAINGMSGYIYHAVPIVTVTYMRGNGAALANFQALPFNHPVGIMQLQQLFAGFHIDQGLPQAVLQNVNMGGATGFLK